MAALPFLVKNSLEYFPVNMSLRGTAPSSSMIKAMWSTITHRECRAGRGVVRWRGGPNIGQLDQTVLIQSFTHPEQRDERENKETQPCPDSTDGGHIVNYFHIRDSD